MQPRARAAFVEVSSTAHVRNSADARTDLLVVAELVRPRIESARRRLRRRSTLAAAGKERAVDGRGLESSQSGVNDCVAKGLSVIQGDADADLVDYPDGGFDYVILSQTFQATRRPRVVLEHMLRIGRAPSFRCRISAIGEYAPNSRSPAACR